MPTSDLVSGTRTLVAVFVGGSMRPFPALAQKAKRLWLLRMYVKVAWHCPVSFSRVLTESQNLMLKEVRQVVVYVEDPEGVIEHAAIHDT